MVCRILSALLLLCLAACAHGVPPDTERIPCPSLTLDCPAGAVSEQCAPGDGTAPCCFDDRLVFVCTRPAGILTAECPSVCTSDQCAISGEVTTCCFPISPQHPVDQCGMSVDGGTP